MATETKVEQKTTEPVAAVKPPEAPPVVQAPAPVLPLPKPPAHDPEVEPDIDPRWVARRLDRHTKALLGELGVTSKEDALKIINEAKVKADAEKGAIEKLTEKAAKIPALEKQRDDLASALGEHAKEAMRGLTTEQRAAVKALAPEDPARQLEVIRALKSTWAAPVVEVPPVVEAAPKPVEAPAPPPAAQVPPKPAGPTKVPPAATTVPPAGAPPAGSVPPQVDHVLVMETLDAINPVRAAAYYEKHKPAIDAQRAAKKTTQAA